MASGQFITAKLMRSTNDTPWGFRLQGGVEFKTPLLVVKVTGGSLAQQSGMQVGDILLKINGQECEHMRHKEAQDAIVCGGNYLELYLERGSTNTWRPSVTPVTSEVRPGQPIVGGQQQVYTKTSLAKSHDDSAPIGSGHNTTAKPFGSGPTLVHKQYNSPVNLYSEKNIEETLNAHTQVLATGATGINFMRPDAPVNKESAVYQMVHDEEMRKTQGFSTSPDPKTTEPVSGSPTKHVEPPRGIPKGSNAVQDGKNCNICAECERLIVGVFVRINNKSFHAECFRCSTCGTSLKNIGYFNINDKLYCDIHARQIKATMNGSSVLSSAPNPSHMVAENKITNGHGGQNGYSAPQGVSLVENQPPVITPSPISGSLTAASNRTSYQSPLSTAPASQNGYSTLRKYSPVVPPTAPKPNFNANRNSVYLSNPSTFVTESHTTDRQGVQHDNRPKSCYSSLPSAYMATTHTSNIVEHNASPSSTNAGLQCPKTASFASSTQTTTQKVITAPAAVKTPGQEVGGCNALPQSNFAPNSARQWSTTTSTYGKTSVSDARSAPKRGRGLLQSQLSGGVIPFCGYCSQPIRGQYIMALNKCWCPNHFVCANTLCKRSLEENGFVEEQGRLYCENCYETHFAPSCTKCNQRIKGDCLNALNKQWHPNCFICSHCKKPFGNSSFYLEDGFPYCEKDWNDLFTTKCVGCCLPIAAGDRWVEALNQNYHSNCFRCTVCRGTLEGQSFFAKGGKPFCKVHAR